MALLDIQRRMTEIGRIRIGVKDGNRPKKIETFRITSQSQEIIEAVAAMYGGTVTPWKPDPKGAQQYEVITEATTLDIVVAPGQVLTAFYELWSGGGCQRRCDGYNEMLSDSPCICPADPQERRELAAKGGACKPTTRLSVMLRDVPAIGLFRLETHGYYAAVELSGVAEILEYATKRGLFIPARLRLDQRTSKKGGQTRRYAVPVIEIAASFAQVNEALGGIGPSNSLQSGQPAVAALPEAGRGPSLPALPAGGEGGAGSGVAAAERAPLPSAPRGRQSAKVALPADRPPLPADPSFKIEVDLEPEPQPPKPALTVVPPPPPADPFEGIPTGAPDKPALGALKRNDRGQQLAMSARRNDIDDDTRHALIEWVTDGRTSSGSEVSDEEASRLHGLFAELKRGRKTMSFDGDGKLVRVE